jgi:hypothetical protein
MPKVDGQDSVFGALEEMFHAVCKLIGFKNGVCDMQVLGTPDAEAVEDEVENLRGIHEVAAVREQSEVDAQPVDALEARGRALQGPEVLHVNMC